ncbi:hypothetical protein CMEL01_00654 [Colletotrichum melonis]|uniref:Uncharacterized protein n=1 Tax=Colletotrichum melonis TaxID=1209925 RepID=A0AAI9V1K9_9PEZI|nr:hypothetical protein CMEL01_00654 [Colletotrichum melonis]
MTLVSPASVLTQLLFLAFDFLHPARPRLWWTTCHSSAQQITGQDSETHSLRHRTVLHIGARIRTFGFCVAFFISTGIFFATAFFSSWVH